MAPTSRQNRLKGLNQARRLFSLKVVASRLRPGALATLAGITLTGRESGETEVVHLDNGQDITLVMCKHQILTKMLCPKCGDGYKNLFRPHKNDPDREQLFLCYNCHGLKSIGGTFRCTQMSKPLIADVLRPLERLQEIDDELEVLATRSTERPADRVHELLKERDTLTNNLRLCPTYSLYRLRLENVTQYIPGPVEKLVPRNAKVPRKTRIANKDRQVQPGVLQAARGPDQVAQEDALPEAEVAEVEDQHRREDKVGEVPHQAPAVEEKAFEHAAPRGSAGPVAPDE